MSEEKRHTVSEVLGLTMEKIKQMVDTDTMVGRPITVGDVTVVPISKISVGFASGGTDFSKKKPEADGSNFGGGGGAGITITPMAFLVIAQGTVRVLGVDAAPMTTVDRVIDLIPGLIDKVEGFIEKKNEKKEETEPQ